MRGLIEVPMYSVQCMEAHSSVGNSKAYITGTGACGIRTAPLTGMSEDVQTDSLLHITFYRGPGIGCSYCGRVKMIEVRGARKLHGWCLVSFFDAPSHLYKRVCPFVRSSVRPQLFSDAY